MRDVVKKVAFPSIAIAIFFLGMYLVVKPDVTSITAWMSNAVPTEKRDTGVRLSQGEIQTLNGKELAAYWHARISAVGGEAAYAEFHEDYNGIDPNEQHTSAHVFGGTLYAVEGVDGFSVCDLQYSYGCYHEFLGQAIFHEGMQVVEELNQGCYDDLVADGQELSCQHGIGHGILAAIGYETNVLPDALETCRDLPYGDPIGGCYGGVFMEYNLRTMLSLDGVPSREKESDSLLEPCKSMPEYSQVACYYWQPQWWLTVLRDEGYRTRADRHTKMGDLCDELGNGELRDTCYKGIGNNIITTGITPRDAAALCAAAASDDLRAEVLCRADAANSFFVAPGLTEQAGDVCDGLTGTYRDYCLAYSANQLNLANQGNI